MSVDLSTQYLGFKLASPLVASASPYTGRTETLRQLEDAGIAAAVLPSFFEEQIKHEEQELNRLYQYQVDSYAESLSYFPEVDDYRLGTHTYLKHVEEAKQVCSIPIIGSLNGSSEGGWTQYAKQIQEAGADALELNVYYVPTDPSISSADVEQRYVDLVAAVRAEISIPLAVKIGQNFSSLPQLATRLIDAGADGLVLFNRWLEPDIDLETMQVTPNLILSNRAEIRAPLRWIAILREHISGSLAATSGVHMAEDAIKLLLAGADVTMMTSVILTHGIPHVQTIRTGLEEWLEENEYISVEQMKGSMSRANCPNPSELERGNYMKALASYTPDFAP